MRLRRSDPQRPGLRRIRHGRGFRYVDADGAVVDAETLARIRELVIPPAWEDVWICPYPNGHLQAVGTDDAGRRQYLYHPEHHERQTVDKHDRVLTLARRLPRVREAVAADLDTGGLGRERVVAVALRMLDHGVFRTGGEEYASENGSQGVATLNRDDVCQRNGTLEFCFTAKGGLERTVTLRDPLLAKAVVALRRSRPTGTDRLLCYREGRSGGSGTGSGSGEWREVRAADVNARFKELAGDDYTVKDLRTWHATVLAAVGVAHGNKALEDGTGGSGGRGGKGDRGTSVTARRRLIRAVIKDVAEELGNTPAVARRSYVDPRVLELYENGEPMGRTLSTFDPADLIDLEIRHQAERAVIRLLK